MLCPFTNFSHFLSVQQRHFCRYKLFYDFYSFYPPAPSRTHNTVYTVYICTHMHDPQTGLWLINTTVLRFCVRYTQLCSAVTEKSRGPSWRNRMICFFVDIVQYDPVVLDYKEYFFICFRNLILKNKTMPNLCKTFRQVHW
jgi:hypothetical protein